MMIERMTHLGTLHSKGQGKASGIVCLWAMYSYDSTTKCEIPIELALMMMVSKVSHRCGTWNSWNKLCFLVLVSSITFSPVLTDSTSFCTCVLDTQLQRTGRGATGRKPASTSPGVFAKNFHEVDLHAGGMPKPVRFLELPRPPNHAATKTGPLSLSALATTSRGWSVSAIVHVK